MRDCGTNNNCRRRLEFVVSLWFLSPMEVLVMAQNTTTVPVNVGLILDSHIEASKVALSCINMALSDFYASNGHYTTRLVIQPRDSKEDVVAAAAAGLDLIKNERVQAILGPATSMRADFVSDIGEKARVPIVSFSATSPSLTSPRRSYFFRAKNNDAAQVHAITAIVQAFGWKEAVPVYIDDDDDDDYGGGVIPHLTDALQAVDVRVPYRSAISSVATDDQIVEELYKLMTMQTRVFVLHTSFHLGSRLFTMAKEIGMMGPGYAWIMTDGMTNFFSTLNSSVIDSMQGVLGVKPYVPNTGELDSFLVRWKRKFLLDNPDILNADVNVYGLWAYDATMALAMAIEEAGAANLSFQMPTSSSSNSTDLETFGVSRNGPNLIQALSKTSFKGLSGNFSFVGGQLQSSTFEIVNVNGHAARGIGFWTAENGLARTLSSPITITRSYSTSNSSLAPVIWPGDTTTVPRGWVFPTSGKKLKVGVPKKDGYTEFVKVTIDATTNATTGYCIDVFEAVVEALPYALPFEYVPIDTTSAAYNDLVYQVYLGKFDIVVGDVTIRANRSLYVDFTLPYTESGVSMIVPVKDNKSNNAWAFLKPLTWEMWVTSFCFFVLMGFCVWVLEHRINKDFRGPPAHHVGTSFWFSFSTMVFAHRERVISNLARVVVVIWCFVVLILTQSYTASLTSLLTVQQLLPTVTDVNTLIKNREFVGYQKGSFVFGLLKGLGFDESRLISYNSTEQCNELFSKGSGNGGIAAAFDEVPYIKLFLARFCSKYATIEPTFKTAGFAFVVPRGSSLGPDISRAILNVTEGDKMKEIENTWFGNQANCPDPSTFVTSNSLGLNSFWGLFLIAGGASVLALLIFVATFIYENRSELMPSDSGPSIWQRVRNLIRKFDERDLRSHAFRRTELANRNVDDINAIPIMVGRPSPIAYSVHTESPREEGTPSPEYGDHNTNGQSPQHRAVLNIEVIDPPVAAQLDDC